MAARTARRLATSGHSSLSRHQNSQMAGWRATPVCREPKDEAVIRRPRKALEALRSHPERQLEEMLRARDHENLDLVFATGKGTPLNAQNMVNCHYKPLLKEADLPPSAVMTSGTRAPLHFRGAVHPKLVQHLLGHGSITMTLDRFSHR
jgi:integrase